MIRTCRNDPSELSKIRLLYQERIGRSISPEELQHALDPNERELLLVCVEGTLVQGFAHAVWAGGPYELMAIATAVDAERRGVARNLLAHLLSLGPLREAGEMWLEVRRQNRAAQSLYLGTGAVVTGVRKAYYDDGDDAILMTYSLI